MSMQHALVTGANGFVGSALVRRLLREPGLAVVGTVRSDDRTVPPGARRRSVGDIGADTDWRGALAGVDTVFHVAARVHVMREAEADALAAFRRVNTDGTLNLARQCVTAGVRRLVFVSSIKVNGESTPPGRPFRADDTPAPQDAYGISKWEAEQALWQLARSSALDVVVVRPPLVYGPGVKANFQRMLAWLMRGVPLPLGAVHNRRSLVALDNLADLLAIAGAHPAAPGRTFLVSDGEDLSTPQLLERLGTCLGHKARLFALNPHALEVLLGGLGRPAIAQRLLGSLQVDLGATRSRLGWTPPRSVDDALAETAAWFLREAR